LIVSRAITREPIAAWTGTSKNCRGISSRSRSTSARRARRPVAVDDQRQRVDQLARDQDVDALELPSRNPTTS
jgi:hypothetical protein